MYDNDDDDEGIISHTHTYARKKRTEHHYAAYNCPPFARFAGRYPLQQTLLVALTEALKCLLVTAMHVATSGSLRMRPSPKFLLPSLIYMLTNNIFFFVLRYVTPAVWVVLVQCKIIITLCVYR